MDRLRKFLQETENAKIYLGIIFIVGILLFTSGSFMKSSDNGVEDVDEVSKTTKNEMGTDLSSTSYDTYEQELTANLESILSMVSGAGNVKCMITFENTKEMVFATDFEEDSSSVIEKDSQNGERTTKNENRDEKLVFVGDNEPVLIKEVLPKVEGVVIVAQGGENAYIKKAFIDVATSLLDIEPYKVTILKMN